VSGPAELLGPVTSILVQYEPAMTNPSEGTPADIVYDVPAEHDVHLDRSGARTTVMVTARSGRPETAEVFGVTVTGAEVLSTDAGSIVLTGMEFARGHARRVTLTLVS
jgi:hypothetical protein